MWVSYGGVEVGDIGRLRCGQQLDSAIKGQVCIDLTRWWRPRTRRGMEFAGWGVRALGMGVIPARKGCISLRNSE